MKESMRIGAVLTCYNRREKTLVCLEKLYQQSAVKSGRVSVEVFLTDDGSTDGTSEAVKEAFPGVHVFQGTGSLYWNGGMNLAFGKALQQNMDYYLWLNDDTFLYEDAIDKLLDTHEDMSKRSEPNSIILGGTVDPNTKEFSYGGFKRLSRWTLKMEAVIPGDHPKRCTSNTGNCVLIPKSVSDKVGNIEPFYTHRWGDPDYGLRAGKLGCSIWLAPGYVAECESNPTAERWASPSLSFAERIKDFHSIKGYIKKDWYFFVKRHGGILWFALWMKPYFDMVMLSMKDMFRGSKKIQAQTH
ncbi:MAG: glycosyltransferase family 2 protein [Bacteroidota bacterium]